MTMSLDIVEGDGSGNRTVELPTISCDEPREIGVPETVIAGPSGETVSPATTTPDVPSVNTCPASVKMLSGLDGGIGTLVDPTIRFPEPS